VRGQSDDELLANARDHIRTDHPDMDGQVTDDQLLGMVQEEPSRA
jgi:hypothetical protein